MATLLDIAQAAGVSKMTVSNALRGKSNVSEATRTRIIQAANQLNYQTNLAARALSSGRIGILELIIQDLDSPFYGKLAKEVSLAADRHGMQMLIRQSLYSAESEKSALSTTNSLFCDGLILATPQLSGKEARRLAQQRPLILIDDCSPDPQLATVNTPNYEGAYQAVTHLLSVGVTCPLLLGGTFINDIDAIAANAADTANANTANVANQDTAGAINPDTANPDTTNATNPDTPSPDTAQNTLPGHTPTHRPLRTVNELRVAGAAQALRDANLTLNPTQCLPIEWTYDLARKAIHDIARRSPVGTFPFDGIFGMSDVAALGAIRGLQDIGLRVPDDVKVIGFDGVTYGDIATPSLSTIDIDMTAMANIIVTRLMEQLDRIHKSENKIGANAANVTSEADKSEANTSEADTTRTAHTDNTVHATHATSARGKSAYTPTVDIAPFTLRARESTFSRDVRKA